MKTTTSKILFLLATLLITVSNAQQVSDSTKLKIDLAATGNVQTGNFERLQFINQLNFSLDSKDSKWNLHSRHLYLYQKVFGNKSQDDYLTRNFLTYRINEKLDVFGGFFYEKFFIKRIDRNIQYGVGTRYAIIKKQRAFVQLGLMGSYANKKYVGANFQDFDNGGSDTIDGFFISPVLNSKFVIVPKRLIFNFLFWFQQDVGESENYRFNIETSLLAPVYKGLSLKVSFNDFYENINLVGAKANDTFLTYGLSYKFER
ncbi:DUF481 domain-containing protein [Flagellimonas sp. S174]|uniref:DUF481 domain-containing protein n=1 Tax=Flagellimonas sp. S174 TaxID=3410790 RepID=UPI003BF59B52